MSPDLDAVAAEFTRSRFGKGLDPKETKQEIAATIDSVRRRLRWQIGSECLLFLKSTRKWVDGEIVAITVDTAVNVDLMVIRYAADQNIEIPRFDIAVRPKETGKRITIDLALYRFIVDRMRLKQRDRESGDGAADGTLSHFAMCSDHEITIHFAARSDHKL